MDMAVAISLSVNLIQSGKAITKLFSNFNFFALDETEAKERLNWIKELEDPTTCPTLK